MAEAIRDVGAEHFVAASDLGQTGNPVHPYGMVEMIIGLMRAGVFENRYRQDGALEPRQASGFE